MDKMDHFLDLVLAGMYVAMIVVGLFVLIIGWMQDPAIFWEDMVFTVFGIALVALPVYLYGRNDSEPE